jgi:hypothetical protein
MDTLWRQESALNKEDNEQAVDINCEMEHKFPESLIEEAVAIWKERWKDLRERERHFADEFAKLRRIDEEIAEALRLKEDALAKKREAMPSPADVDWVTAAKWQKIINAQQARQENLEGRRKRLRKYLGL